MQPGNAGMAGSIRIFLFGPRRLPTPIAGRFFASITKEPHTAQKIPSACASAGPSDGAARGASSEFKASNAFHLQGLG